MIEKAVQRIAKDIDIIAGIIGIFLGIFIIYLYYAINLRQRDIGFVILAASLIYLLFRNKFKTTVFTPLKNDHREKLLLNIIFFIVFSVTLLLYRMQLYRRPLSYFVLVSLLAGIIAIEILYFRKEDRISVILLKIFLLSVNIRAGIYYNFPTIMGADAFWHAQIIEQITNIGFIPPVEISKSYFQYPIFHIFVSICQIINQIDIKDALFYSIGLNSIISTFFLYYIVKKLAGPHVGLLATLLVNISDSIIDTGITNIIPASLVLGYFLLVLYLLFNEEHKFINKSLLLFITFLSIITHQLSTFVFFISVTSIYVGKIAYKIIYKLKENIIINLSYLLLFAVALQSYWMNTDAYKGQSFFDYVVGPLVKVLGSKTELGGEEVVTSAVNYNTSANVLFHLGYLILLFFAIGGILLWLSSKDDKKFSIVTAVFVLFFFVYGVSLFAINNMLPGRWFPFTYVFLAMLSSAYLLRITQSIKYNLKKILFIFSIIFIISFLMITTPNINKDSPLYAEERVDRSQLKFSEVSAITTINNVYNGTIKTDYSYIGGLFRQITIKSTVVSFDVNYIASSAQEKNGTMIVLRTSALNEPVSITDTEGFGGYKHQLLPKEFFDRFKSSNYDLVYANGGVLIYASR